MSIIDNMYLNPWLEGCIYTISMLKASLGYSGIILLWPNMSGKYLVVSLYCWHSLQVFAYVTESDNMEGQ